MREQFMTLPGPTIRTSALFAPPQDEPQPGPDQASAATRWVIGSFEESRDAAVRVAACARRGLAILTPDLEPGVYDSEAFLDITKRLVLAKRYARVRVLISDPARTARNGNLLVGLGRRLNTYIEFRNVHEDYREHREAFLLADDRALLYRADGSRFEGIAGTDEPVVARRYLDLFEEIWTASETSKELRQLRV